ncbi:hypothetical protein [Streptomyces chartreusis]|uniref:hypothetical protein n=1 Tax=Streptomyces chartreusis TaxID=1969 RepID=UPI002E17CF7A
MATAAHCSPERGWKFAPAYSRGRHAPLGLWPVDKTWGDPRFPGERGGEDWRHDWKFVRLLPGPGGKSVQDAVGGGFTMPDRPLQFPSTMPDITVVGYPGGAGAPQRRCMTGAAQPDGSDGHRPIPARTGYWQVKCPAFPGGASGSPFVSKMSTDGAAGTLIGVLGGAGRGGGHTPDVSYASRFDPDAYSLFKMAEANQWSMGGGSTWQHAKHLASGEYTGDGKGDLIVVWSDGEVTLYVGDGNAGFTGERRLKAPNATWKHVKSITGGDFAGGNGSDVMVVWTDGEVSLHPDVNTAGFHREITLAKAGDATWKYARQIAGGNFGTAGHTTDLLVVWQDGEVSTYTQVGEGGFGTEHQLLKPNDLWKKHATVVTAGDFTGGNNWDAMVRWSDGELTVYADTGAAGIGAERKLHGPDSTWTHATVMTAGSYDGNGWADDLFVLWSDGEFDAYPRTGTALGPEHRLVNPKA